MADDDRTRRRLGDETKARIDDLASGWSVETPDPDAAPELFEGAPPPRGKQRTIPPPAPGSPERTAYDEQIVIAPSRAAREDQTEDETDVRPPRQGQGPLSPSSEDLVIAPSGDPRGDETADTDVKPPRPTPGRPRPPPAPRSAGNTGLNPVIAPRSQLQTGQEPVASSPPTGRQAALARPTTGQHPVIGPRSSSATGQVPTLPPPLPEGARAKPSSPPPPPGSPQRGTSSAPRPASADRSKPSSVPPSGLPERSKPSIAIPAGPDTEPTPRVADPFAPPERAGSASWPPASPGAGRSKSISASPANIIPASATAAIRSRPISVPPPVSATVATGSDAADLLAGDGTEPIARVEEPIDGAERSTSASVPPPAKPERSAPARVPPPTATPSTRTPIIATTAKRADSTDQLLLMDVEIVHTPAPERIAPAASPARTVPATSASSAPQTFGSEQRTFSSETRTPPVIVDASIPSTTGAPLAAPTRPAAAPKSVVAPEPPVVAEPPATRTKRFDRADRADRADPTTDAKPDATAIEGHRPKYPTAGTLRRMAALRRKRGRWGDVRYVFTAVFGVQRARRELEELEHRQALRETSRRRHLITLGRAAAALDSFDHPVLTKAREQLALIEDERSKHAGAVAASDAELERVRRDRDNASKQHAIGISEADAELAELAKKLEPVEKEAVAIRKRAGDLRDEVHRIEKQIADAEAKIVSPRSSEKVDRDALRADVATFKANREAVLRDEPVIASELDAINPRIAAMEGTRSELLKRKAALDKAEQEDQKRTMELLEAIGAKRKVVERAAADAETARDNALFELGDTLYVERPATLGPELSPIDQIDVEVGESERRTMELKEILSNIDKAKLARGLAIIILVAAAVVCLTWLVLSLL